MMTGRSAARARGQWRQLVDHPAVHDERYWPAYVALAVAIGLQLGLPAAYDLLPKWIPAAAEVALLLLLVAGRYLSPTRREARTMRRLRVVTLCAVAFITADNLVALGFLVHQLLQGLETDGRTLVLSALTIWITNVIIFGLWFWELDGGGPAPRRALPDTPRDFLFPQMQMASADGEDRPPWQPDFVDYLYTSYTNATAFSPTDTMPLSRWTKALMLVQSAAALLTIALIAARAVNILK